MESPENKLPSIGQEGFLSDSEKMKLGRYFQEIIQHAEKIDELIGKSLEVYGSDAAESVEFHATLNGAKAYENTRYKLNRVLNYLQEEYPNYHWTFEKTGN